MTYWIQHGHGKAQKIANAVGERNVTGVILSPADEAPHNLKGTANSVRELGPEVLLDPQLYVHTIEHAVARCHVDCGIDFGTLSPIVGPSDMSWHVNQILNLNRQIGTDRVIAPSPYQETFGDPWTPTSLQYAQATLDSTNQPVFVSLVAEHMAFADWDTTEAYLDKLTALDAAGIYLIVGTSTENYPFQWRVESLLNVLRAVYILGELSKFEVLVGYTELAGLATVAAGASGAATGWYNSLRMWKKGKWIPQGGGPATPRIFVESLLSPLARETEAVSIANSSMASTVFPDPQERWHLQNTTQWGLTDSWDQYLLAMGDLHDELIQGSGTAERVHHLLGKMRDAEQLLANVGATTALRPDYEEQLDAIVEAVEGFADRENL